MARDFSVIAQIVSKLKSKIFTSLPGHKVFSVGSGAITNNLTVSLNAGSEFVTPAATPYAGYLLREINAVNLDRLTFTKIYKPANTKCQVDVCGLDVISTRYPIPTNAVYGSHFDGSTADLVGSLIPESDTSTSDVVNKKFGTASRLFNNSSIIYPDSTIWDVGANDFYIEFWFKRNVLGVTHYVLGQMDSSSSTASRSIALEFADINVIRFNCTVGTTTYTAITSAIPDTGWHHFRGGRSGNNIIASLDGTIGVPTAISGAVNNSANKFVIGQYGEYTSARFAGNIDEFLFVKNVGMNTTNFTPPTEPYTVPLSSINSTSVTLPTTASTTTDFYKDDIIAVTSGVGVGQTRKITAYNGTTKVATLDQAWTTTPTSASGFALYDGIASNVSPGFDLQSIDYAVCPTINIIASLERQTGATASPSMGVPLVNALGLPRIVQSGVGTATLVAGQTVINITLPVAVNLNTAKRQAWARSTSATGYTVDIVPTLTTPTNLKLEMSGSNATAPVAYSWEVEDL